MVLSDEQIYNEVVLKRRIMITKDGIHELRRSAECMRELEEFVSKYLSVFGNAIIDAPRVVEIREKYSDCAHKKPFSLEYFVPHASSAKTRYHTIRRDIDCVPILCLRPGVRSTVFGMFAKERDTHVLFDDEAKIVLDISDDGPAGRGALLFDGLFYAFSGMQTEGRFVVDGIVPHTRKHRRHIERRHMRNGSYMLLFMSVSLSEHDILDDIATMLDRYADSQLQPVLFVILSHGRSEYSDVSSFLRELSRRFGKTEFLYVPSINDVFPGFMPKSLSKDIFGSDELLNVHFGTNPCYIHMAERTILVYAACVFERAMERLGKSADIRSRYAQIFVDQQCADPFTSHADLFVDADPDLYVIGDCFSQFGSSFRETTVVSCEKYTRTRKNFVAYFSATNTVDLCGMD